MNQSDADSPAPRRPFRVAIMGAGIAGLSAALALRHFFPPPAPAAGHPGAAGAAIQINIYEKATQLREIGASIALNPSGLRILDKLGVAEALRPDMAYRQPSGHPMVYLHWQTSEVLGVDTYRGAVDEERHSTARFHRAHLQAALLRAVQAHGSGDDGVDIRLGKRVQTVESRQGEEGGGGVRITFADGSTAEADMVLGADGIHSPTRRAVAPAEHEPVWTGQVALRATFDAGRLPDEADVPRDAVHIVGHDTTMFASYLGKPKERKGLELVGKSEETDKRPPSVGTLQARISTLLWETTLATRTIPRRRTMPPNGMAQEMLAFSRACTRYV